VKGFVFRLDRLLRLRSSAEREQARSLGEALREEHVRREDLRQAEHELDRRGQTAGEAAAGGVPAGTLRNLNLTVRAAASDLERAEHGLARAEEASRDEQERYREARRDRRVLERLREQRADDWNRAASRAEQREIDEIRPRGTREEDER
jgi:flagellar FliJ protein